MEISCVFFLDPSSVHPDQRTFITGRVTIGSLLVNALLFALKFAGFLMSGSIALFSDAMNSLLDIASSAAVMVSVRVARKEPDREHPFGHARAEPIAGFVVAVIACVIGLEVLQQSITRFLKPVASEEVSPWLFGILGVAIVVKFLLAAWQRNVGTRANSPAIVAASVDSRNDVLSSIAALVGIGGTALGYAGADAVAGLVVGVLILWGGVQILRQNLDYLLGRSPEESLIGNVRESVAGVAGVEEVRFCRGHYVGNELHFEIIVACHGTISTQDSSAIADRVRIAAESHPGVEMAFIHVDAVEDPHHYPELLRKLELR